MTKAPIHILLADDDAFLASIYKKKFEESGYKVTLVDNGESCIRCVIKKNPRLVILDLILSKKDGFSVLESLKNNSKLSHIPIIVFTHLGQKEDVKKAMSLGAAEYLIKSQVTPEEFIAKIQQLLSQ